MQRLAEGDEAMLSVEGIGPKALTEIKAQVEASGLGFLPEVAIAPPAAEAPAQEQIAAPVETVAPAEVTPPAAEAPAPVVEEIPSAADQVAAPVEAVAPPAAEGVVPIVPLPPQLIEEALAEEGELEEDDGTKGGKKKKKARTLVFDERLGTVVAQRKRKPGRQRDVWEVEE
jgi:hypothetical protein